MLEKFLQEIGLNDKEAQVYLALLQVDNDSVLDLAKKTKINRTTIYPILDSLSKKGLISEVKIDKKVRFQAEPPERLETFVERQKVVLDERSSRLKDIIPQLKSVQREIGERPVVKFYEGKEGIISSLEDFFESEDRGGTAYFLYSLDLNNEIVPPNERARYKKMRLDKGIKSKTVYSSTKSEYLSDNTGDRKKIDGNKYPIFCDISIYGDKVKITTLQKSLAAIVVRSKDFADTMISFIKLVSDSPDK